YYFEKTLYNWNDAEVRCQWRGGHLFVPKDLSEWNLVYQTAKQKGIHDFWLGLNDKLIEGEFIAVDGSTSFYKNWKAGEPNNYNNEDCGHSRYDGTWNDHQCLTAKFASVCKMPFHVDMIEFENHKYYVGTEKVTWSEAQASCQYRGAELVSFKDIDESRFIHYEAVNKRGLEKFWIGYTDVVNEGSFKWTDHTEFGFTLFAAGEPNNAGNEHCVYQRKTGYWNDANCELKAGYVCKKPYFNPNRGGKSYRFFKRLSTWDIARQLCEQLKGSLVTIDSEAENEFLARESGNRGFSGTWIGYNDKDVEGTFKWVSGATTCYKKWLSGQPSSPDCVFLNPFTKYWSTSTCGFTRPYICEFNF
uniref:C-type lectin domain-containing protein n=2 Tax=Clytia hemisphaerica TaxID=252671 RepID=A0A7M5XAW9_9CNID